MNHPFKHNRLSQISQRSRRMFLQLGSLGLGSWAIAACTSQMDIAGAGSNDATAQTLPPTPVCGDDNDTPTQTEGPYYTPNSPERSSLLEPGITGTRIILTGQVLTHSCSPVARALVDVWHADDSGNYDNVGYRLRGHQFTDYDGRYRLETIVPGLYPGRTRHFHVKVQAPNQPVLTTQLYWPGESANESDRLFNPALLMAIDEQVDRHQARFNMVLAQ